MLAHVPSDAPYVFAVLDPPSPAVLHKLYGQLPARFEKLVEKARAEQQLGGKPEPWVAAVLELAEIFRGKDLAHWPEEIGLDPGASGVLYGISLWPAVRIGVRDPRRLRQVIERVAGAAGVPLTEQTIAGHRVWSIGNARAAIIAAVLEHEAVIAIVPGGGVEEGVHRLLDPLPAGKSLADTRTIQDLLARYGFLTSLVGYIDSRAVVDALMTSGPFGVGASIDRLRSPECKADLGRVTAFVPRMAFGYHKLDEAGFSGSFVVETPSWFSKAIGKLRTSVPAVPLTGQALLAFGGAFDVDAAIELARQLASDEHAHPMQCTLLAPLDDMIDKLGSFGQLPPVMRGLRGFGLVIEDASKNPPSGTGQLLVVGTQISSTVLQYLGMMHVHITTDGTPAALPLDALGVPGIKSGHIAMRGDRVAIALGPASERRVAAALAAPASPHAPLLAFSYDLPRLRERFGSLLEESDTDLADFGNAAVTLDVREEGVVLDATGTWAPPARQLITSPDGR